mmetsp:Transcript_16218/g.20791  ORF Transcript_16218/g.20791 Transcript_16218/m.20791 type:complete len:81 (-) Transcript_16218:135-377(-)
MVTTVFLGRMDGVNVITAITILLGCVVLARRVGNGSVETATVIRIARIMINGAVVTVYIITNVGMYFQFPAINSVYLIKS